MPRVALVALAAILTGVIVGVALSGDGDDSPERPLSAPDPVIPGGSGTTDKGDSTRDQGTTDAPRTGGSRPPSDSGPDSGGAAPPAEDSPGNDVPPPPGSPAERFENEFCAENPGACR